MCVTDECPDLSPGRREFITAAGAAVIGLAARDFAGQSKYPHNHDVTTRVLDDPNITHGPVIFKHGGKDSIDGYLARPKADGKYPAVLVIAGNVITEEYIPNTCAALAVAGFVGMAPNIFHTLPESAKTPEERRQATIAHTESDCLLDILSGMDYLRDQPFVKNGGMGVVGFCYGGRLAMMLGSRSREIDAVVAYHPGVTTSADIARLKSPVQIHQGTADRAVPPDNARVIEKMLKDQKTSVEVFWYEGADHGFLAYTRPFYRPDQGKLSWNRSVAFLKKHLAAKAR